MPGPGERSGVTACCHREATPRRRWVALEAKLFEDRFCRLPCTDQAGPIMTPRRLAGRLSDPIKSIIPSHGLRWHGCASIAQRSGDPIRATGPQARLCTAAHANISQRWGLHSPAIWGLRGEDSILGGCSLNRVCGTEQCAFP